MENCQVGNIMPKSAEECFKMPIYQAYNGRIKAWVKYHFTKKGVEFTDIKQRNKSKPFKGVKIRGNKK